MEELTKVCTKCGIEKPLSEYNKRKDGKYGVRAYCKCCLNKDRVEYLNKPEVKPHHAKYRAEYYTKPENKAKKTKYQVEWYTKPENKEKQDEYYSTPKAKAYRAEYHARTKAESLNACPLEWYLQDKEKIDALYLEAAMKTAETGILHVVDHIIPFKNKLVNGLHVYCNLQILTNEENQIKHNKLLDFS